MILHPCGSWTGKDRALHGGEEGRADLRLEGQTLPWRWGGAYLPAGADQWLQSPLANGCSTELEPPVSSSERRMPRRRASSSSSAPFASDLFIAGALLSSSSQFTLLELSEIVSIRGEEEVERR